MSLKKQIYYILKTIDDIDDFSTFDIDKTFYLDELKIESNKFYHLLDNLISENYIDGLSMRFSSNDMPIININKPHLTIKGRTFLEENTKLKNLYKIIKETRNWF